MPILTAIVEDDPTIRDGLKLLISFMADIECIATFASAEEAIAQLPTLIPHVVLMDIHLPAASGIDAVAQLSPLLPDTRFIMLTVKADTEAIFQAFAAGADGYLLKPATARELEAALHDAISGGAPMTSHIARQVIQSFKTPTPAPLKPEPDPSASELSSRETEVLDLLAKGYLYKEVADQLGIAYPTVHTYVKRIYGKLQVRGRMAAVRKYLGM